MSGRYNEEWRAVFSDFDLFAARLAEKLQARGADPAPVDRDAELALDGLWELSLIVQKLVKQASSIEAYLRAKSPVLTRASDEDARTWLDRHHVCAEDSEDLRRQNDLLSPMARRVLYLLRREGEARLFHPGSQTWCVWIADDQFFPFSAEQAAELIRHGYATRETRSEQVPATGTGLTAIGRAAPNVAVLVDVLLPRPVLSGDDN